MAQWDPLSSPLSLHWGAPVPAFRRLTALGPAPRALWGAVAGPPRAHVQAVAANETGCVRLTLGSVLPSTQHFSRQRVLSERQGGDHGPILQIWLLNTSPLKTHQAVGVWSEQELSSPCPRGACGLEGEKRPRVWMGASLHPKGSALQVGRQEVHNRNHLDQGLYQELV